MPCRERAQLWAFAVGELEAAARQGIDEHLADCPSCREALEGVCASRELLAMAGAVPPAVDWPKADAAVMASAWSALLPARDSRPVLWAFGAGALAGAVAVAAIVASRVPQAQREAAVAQIAELSVAAPVEEAARVELAMGATLVRQQIVEQPLAPGAQLPVGATVRTTGGGSALLALPDASRVHLSAASEVVLRRARKDSIALSVARGTVSVRVAHVPGRELTVDAGEVAVRAVGTAFSVTADERSIRVAVAEGTVEVESANAPAQLLGAGRSVRIDRASASRQQVEMSPEEHDGFKQLGVEPVARPGGEPLPIAAVQAPSPAVRVPDLSFESWPAQAPPSQAAVALPMAAPAPAAPGVELPTTIEMLFLRRAEGSIGKGDCSRFFLGLEEMIEGTEDRAAREKARYLRARCYEDRVMPVEADAEFRRYLREYPAGRWAPEARRAVAH